MSSRTPPSGEPGLGAPAPPVVRGAVLRVTRSGDLSGDRFQPIQFRRGRSHRGCGGVLREPGPAVVPGMGP